MTAQTLGALAHADDAEMARLLPVRRRALTVIAYFQVQFVVDDDDLHVNLAGLRVPQCIGQGLLHDAVGGGRQVIFQAIQRRFNQHA